MLRRGSVLAKRDLSMIKLLEKANIELCELGLYPMKFSPHHVYRLQDVWCALVWSKVIEGIFFKSLWILNAHSPTYGSHIHMSTAKDAIGETIQKAKASGVEKISLCSTGVHDWDTVANLARSYPVTTLWIICFRSHTTCFDDQSNWNMKGKFCASCVFGVVFHCPKLWRTSLVGSRSIWRMAWEVCYLLKT